MEISAEGIVLRRRDSGESDRRITVLTAEYGKFDAVAKGSRKPASRLAGVSEPLSIAQFTFAKGKANRFVTQAVPKSAYRQLRTDFLRLSSAIAYCEAVAAISPYENADADFYAHVRDALGQIESHSSPIIALIWAEMRLIEAAGFLPEFAASVASGNIVTGDRRWFSPSLGGVLMEGEAARVTDSFLAPREALLGLAKISALEVPPANLKFADECLKLLFRIMRNVADMPLPANESLLQSTQSPIPK